ncbi:hypothetical protein [Cohnella abietis]|uniref:Uncharacterized protein n=1 Tax=Cohnella abietis TaxID=2507935 RepID=A0A3T1D5E4_9BACL|nr:hypothetical protein [Cohnella abietis]BBI33332.1 hypothetical protein KCTCHS21_27310 [Cohnella abietis]
MIHKTEQHLVLFVGIRIGDSKTGKGPNGNAANERKTSVTFGQPIETTYGGKK